MPGSAMPWSNTSRRSSRWLLAMISSLPFHKRFRNAALSERSPKALSGSIIQNSAKWRLVF
jgi:hypothetical protein